MQKVVNLNHRQKDRHIGFIRSETLGLEVLGRAFTYHFSNQLFYFVQFPSFPFSIFKEIPHEKSCDFRVISKVKTTFLYKKMI